MPRLAPEPQLAHNTRKTYHSRREQLDTSSPEELVASTERILATAPPIGTALPTRAAALRTLMAAFNIPQGVANDMLPTVKGLKSDFVRDWLQPSQLEAYYKEVDALPWGPVRVALTLFPQTGLRPAEMVALRAEQVVPTDRGTYLLKVHGKSKEPRLVPVLDQGARVLSKYMGGVSGFLFPGRKAGAAMSDQVLRHAVSGYLNYRDKKWHPGIGEAIGVKKLTLYMLRHTYATNLLEAGVSIEKIAELLGHEDIETTRIYAHLQASTLEAAAAKASRKQYGRGARSANECYACDECGLARCEASW